MSSENQFEKLSAEKETNRFAQMTPKEHSELQTWIDDTRNQDTEKQREPRRIKSQLP